MLAKIQKSPDEQTSYQKSDSPRLLSSVFPIVNDNVLISDPQTLIFAFSPAFDNRQIHYYTEHCRHQYCVFTANSSETTSA